VESRPKKNNMTDCKKGTVGGHQWVGRRENEKKIKIFM
jgi:hypothetical protein